MIAMSRLGQAAALAIALAAHGALAVVLVGAPQIQSEGAPGGADLRLGTSFADMAAGRLQPQPVSDQVVALPPAPAVAARSADMSAYAVPQAPAPIAPEAAQPVSDPGPALPAKPVLPAPSQPVSAAPLMPQPGTPLVAGGRQPAAPAQPQPETAQAAAPIAPIATAPVQDVAGVAVTGQDPEFATVTRSLVPPPRSAAFEQAHKDTPTPQTRRAAAARAAAERNARAGAAAGRASGQTTTRGSGRSAAMGNAAASNYPGQVMARLSRVPRPDVAARGTAVVRFTIASGGGLASVSIQRSSGSPALDRAALRVVQRAAPFPRPPAGAQRSFTLPVTAR